MSDVLINPEALLDAEGRVAVDAPCLNCGYNLRSLDSRSVGPECRSTVIVSLQSAWLRFANGKWVHRVARGLRLLIISVLMSAGFFALMMLAAFMFAAAARSQTPLGNAEVGIILFYVLMIACWIVSIVGTVQFTSPEPGSKVIGTDRPSRRIVRFCLWTSLILFLFYILQMIDLRIRGVRLELEGPMAVFGIGTRDPMRILFGICILLQLIVGSFILPLAFLRHMGSLLRRTPRKGLLTFARLEFWLLMFSIVTTSGGYSVMFNPRISPIFPISVPVTTTAPTVVGATLTKSVYNATTGVTTVTTITSMPSGPPAITTTSMPGPLGIGGGATTAPAAIMTPPFRPSGLFLIGSLIGGLGGCLMLPVGIAGIVLLVLTYRAVRDEARITGTNLASDQMSTMTRAS